MGTGNVNEHRVGVLSPHDGRPSEKFGDLPVAVKQPVR
jgi:hypothetical protein